MIIIHIACVHDNPFAGVVKAVPQHVIAQQDFADVAYINIDNITDDSVKHQFKYKRGMYVKDLLSPFNNPDIVVFHELYHQEFLHFSHELNKRNIPYVVIPHGCLSRVAQHKKWIKKKLGNLYFFSFLHKASTIQFLSDFERKNSCFNKKSFVAPNGVIIPDMKKNAFNQTRIVFSYIGRLDFEIKGIDLLLGAINQNKEYLQTNNCIFQLFGPSDSDSLQKCDSLIKFFGIEKTVLLFPPVSGKEKESVLLNTDIYIQTSRTEGMPQGILEALSYGIPCLVTRGTNMGTIVKDNNAGWVSDTNIESIKCTMISAIENKNKWKQMGENGRLVIEKEYSWNTVAKLSISKYLQVLQKEPFQN